ncbi:hypothetical protein E4U26_005984 [Claviceps purpurea]|nr:hypothetical protein E4U26_005984 [Claviceps purpurea]
MSSTPASRRLTYLRICYRESFLAIVPKGSGCGEKIVACALEATRAALLLDRWCILEMRSSVKSLKQYRNDPMTYGRWYAEGFGARRGDTRLSRIDNEGILYMLKAQQVSGLPGCDATQGTDLADDLPLCRCRAATN